MRAGKLQTGAPDHHVALTHLGDLTDAPIKDTLRQQSPGSLPTLQSLRLVIATNSHIAGTGNVLAGPVEQCLDNAIGLQTSVAPSAKPLVHHTFNFFCQNLFEFQPYPLVDSNLDTV